MTAIIDITAREILDSRAVPTLEVDITCEDGSLGRACVPSGASTGKHEAHEKRDGDAKRYGGRGVLDARDRVNGTIADSLCGFDVEDQHEIDATLAALDGQPDKSRFGANALLAVSLACARAGAVASGTALYTYLGGRLASLMPVPMMNLLNGGAHADNGLRLQEFMIAPVGADGFSQALQWGVEVYHALKSLLRAAGLRTNVGDEGGFAPDLQSNTQALDYLSEAVEKAGLRAGRDIVFALDCAASEFFTDGRYGFDGATRTSAEMIDIYAGLCESYPIYSIEDGLAEDDWEGWAALMRRAKERKSFASQIVGDDLFATNPARIGKGLAHGAATAVLVKLNQIGTLSEADAALQLATEGGMRAVISHRSGETEDSFIADYAVAANAGQIKCGAPARGERTAKYNRLLRIEEELGAAARYAGHALQASLKRRLQ